MIMTTNPVTNLSKNVTAEYTNPPSFVFGPIISAVMLRLLIMVIELPAPSKIATANKCNCEALEGVPRATHALAARPMTEPNM